MLTKNALIDAKMDEMLEDSGAADFWETSEKNPTLEDGHDPSYIAGWNKAKAAWEDTLAQIRVDNYNWPDESENDDWVGYP